MRVLKAFFVLAAVFFLAIAVGSATDNEVYAGGGIDYTVAVRNPTDGTCRVWVMVSKAAVNTPREDVEIQPGGSYTWHTGALCPTGVKGEYWDKKHKAWRKMQCKNMYGHNYECKGGLGAVAVCASKKFYVYRQTGMEEVRDNDFTFHLE